MVDIKALAEQLTTNKDNKTIAKGHPLHATINALGNYDFAMLSEEVSKRGKTLYWEMFGNKFVVED